jgi:hypothetical protein
VTVAAKGSGRDRPLARLRLARIAEAERTQPPARERPPVFHVFEELYARTLRNVEARLTRPRASGLGSHSAEKRAAGNP